MMRLEDREWKMFTLEDIFNILPGKRLEKRNMIAGDRPFIGASDSNNGLTAYCGNVNESLDRNVLGINYNGSVCEAFYHAYECIFSDDVKRFHLKHHEDNKLVLLFMGVVIRQQKVKYQYAYKFNEQRMRRQVIMLPVAEDCQPDYQFMEDYMRELMAAKRKKYRQCVEKRLESLGIDTANMREYSEALKSCQWKPVPIVSLFDRFEPGKGKGLNHLEQSEQGITYIGATNRNNGVMCYVKDNGTARKMMQEGNCIGFIKNGDGSAGYAIYKQEPFISTSDVIYGYAKWLNPYTGLFFVAAQDMIKHKYSHGYKRNAQHLKGDRVMLPVTDDGQPDYDFMESFGRKMMINKYNQYLAFINNAEL